jgi:hypothetical protein
MVDPAHSTAFGGESSGRFVAREVRRLDDTADKCGPATAAPRPNQLESHQFHEVNGATALDRKADEAKSPR